jgi:hypothetical protein
MELGVYFNNLTHLEGIHEYLKPSAGNIMENKSCVFNKVSHMVILVPIQYLFKNYLTIYIMMQHQKCIKHRTGATFINPSTYFATLHTT